MDSKTVKKYSLERTKLRRVLTGGKQVKRFYIEYPDLWLIYTINTDDFKKFPNIRSYIDQFKSEITCKEVKQGKHSIYSLHRGRDQQIFLKPKKLLGVITEDEIVVAMDDTQVFASDGLYLFGVRDFIDINYLMGILNSRLFVFIYRLLSLEKGRVLAQVKPTLLHQLPIRQINLSSPADKSRHDRMVKLVERMLALHQQLAAAKIEHEKTALQRQIEATDRQIDALVYELYELTDDEIKIVEGRE